MIWHHGVCGSMFFQSFPNEKEIRENSSLLEGQLFQLDWKGLPRRISTTSASVVRSITGYDRKNVDKKPVPDSRPICKFDRLPMTVWLGVSKFWPRVLFQGGVLIEQSHTTFSRQQRQDLKYLHSSQMSLAPMPTVRAHVSHLFSQSPLTYSRCKVCSRCSRQPKNPWYMEDRTGKGSLKLILLRLLCWIDRHQSQQGSACSARRRKIFQQLTGDRGLASQRKGLQQLMVGIDLIGNSW